MFGGHFSDEVQNIFSQGFAFSKVSDTFVNNQLLKIMSNSSNICVHIVFSTRHRLPLIPRDQEHKIHAYLGGLCNGLNCTPICIGGHLDHVHI